MARENLPVLTPEVTNLAFLYVRLRTNNQTIVRHLLQLRGKRLRFACLYGVRGIQLMSLWYGVHHYGKLGRAIGSGDYCTYSRAGAQYKSEDCTE